MGSCGSSVTHREEPEELSLQQHEGVEQAGRGKGPGQVHRLVSTSSAARLLGHGWLSISLRSCSSAQA